MNKSDAQEMRILLETLLTTGRAPELLQEMGVSIKVGSGRFDSTQITFKVTIAETTEAGDVLSKERNALINIYPGLVDKDVSIYRGIRGKVTEYYSRRPRFPFLVVTPQGKRYKMSVNQMQVHIDQLAGIGSCRRQS
tara:strand:- start:610 stop:1020 length:411 start_codon:yes stop_codon:yes gene_type:complete